MRARRFKRLAFADLLRLGARMKNAKAFLIAADWRPLELSDRDDLRSLFAPPPVQLSLL